MATTCLHDRRGKVSAGRVIAIGMSVVVGFRLMYLTILGMALGWPDAITVVFALLSIPIYNKFDGHDGGPLVGKLLDKLGIGAAGLNAAADVTKHAIDKVGDAVEYVAHEWRDGKEDGII